MSTNLMQKIRDSVWQQFGAGIDMLANVVARCPDQYLQDNKRFYYLLYHSIMFLDYYLTIPPGSFSPQLPFSFREEADRPEGSIGDMIPDKIYSKTELLQWLHHTREKCKAVIDGLTDLAHLDLRFTEGDQEGDLDYPILEILLYNLRHTQHHVGQLHLMIRQGLNLHMDWAFRVGEL